MSSSARATRTRSDAPSGLRPRTPQPRHWGVVILASVVALFGVGSLFSGFASIAQVLVLLGGAALLLSLGAGLVGGLRAAAAPLLLLTLAVTGVGCGDSDASEDLKESYRDAAKETQEWTKESWAAFVESSKEKCAALEERFAELKEKASETSHDVGDDLEEQMAKAKEKMAELKDATADGWAKTREETEALFETVERKLSEAWDSMRADG